MLGIKLNYVSKGAPAVRPSNSCRDVTAWRGIKMVNPVIATRATYPFAMKYHHASHIVMKIVSCIVYVNRDANFSKPRACQWFYYNGALETNHVWFLVVCTHKNITKHTIIFFMPYRRLMNPIFDLMEDQSDPLGWRHNERDCVSNHQPHDCYSTVYSIVDQRKHQISASLAFLRGIHQWPVNSPTKGQ